MNYLVAEEGYNESTNGCNDNTSETRDVVQSMRDAGIPLEGAFSFTSYPPLQLITVLSYVERH